MKNQKKLRIGIMKSNFLIITTIISFFSFYSCNAQSENNDMEKGLYLGQELPGEIPQVFMPGIVSTIKYVELSNTISPDGKEFYFSRRIDGKDIMMVIKMGDDSLNKPAEASFLKTVNGFEPFISPDGSKLYITRFAPPPSFLSEDKNLSPQDMEAQMVNIWVMEKLNSGWGEPKFCVNGMYVTTTNSSTIYTTDIRSASLGICRYKFENGNYSEREHQQGGVNKPMPGAHPAISPDESYIIFDSKRSDNPDDSDLFVSFRNINGTWSEAYNLGNKINTPRSEICAVISPDEKFIFYQSQGDIYWVSTKIIEKLKPKKRNK